MSNEIIRIDLETVTRLTNQIHAAIFVMACDQFWQVPAEIKHNYMWLVIDIATMLRDQVNDAEEVEYEKAA